MGLPAHGLSMAFCLACLFVPYLISCRLRDREYTHFVDLMPVSRAVPVLESIGCCFLVLACLIPSPTASTYPKNAHFRLSSAGLYLNTDAAFSTIAYKDSQCLRGFQEKCNYFQKNFRSTTRVNPRKMKIIEKKVAIYFWPCLARVSEGNIFEHPVNTGALEGFLNLHSNYHLPISLPRSTEQRSASHHPN